MTRPASVKPSSGGGALSAPRSLYVHIPFCVSICPYCDFVVVAGAQARGPGNRIEPFLTALRREIDLRADALDAAWGRPGDRLRPPLETLYFGGGTPSLLAPEQLSGLIGLARDRFGLAAGAEVTLEANPGADERGDPGALVAAGVNRISFGAQALDDAQLRRLGRRHRGGDVATAVAGARAAGIGSINLDLIYDAPGQSVAAFGATLEAALELEPDHLSLYALALEDPDAEGLTGAHGDHLPVSAGARRWRAWARPEQDEDRAAAMYEHAVERLAAGVFAGYEISNWARPGHASRHNLAYWERRSVEAVGPGAHAFDGRTRRWNAARLDRYMDALTAAPGRPATLPPGGSETLDPRAAAAETVILALRTDRGLPRAAATEPPLQRELGWALSAELVRFDAEDRVVLTTRGRLLSNELFARLV